MLFSLFVFGTFWFWGLLAAAMIVMTAFVAREREFKAAMTALIVLAALALFGDFNVLSWLKAHGWMSAAYVGGYLALGVVWCVFKWWRHVKGLIRTYDKERSVYLSQHDVVGDVMPDTLKKRWHDLVRRGCSPLDGLRGHFPPRARDFKGKIVSWGAYWPWSFVWFIINDPIRRLYNGIFETIQGTLQGISDRASRPFAADFAEPPAVPPAPADPSSGHSGGKPAAGHGSAGRPDVAPLGGAPSDYDMK